jgi:hypothetical protein
MSNDWGASEWVTLAAVTGAGIGIVVGARAIMDAVTAATAAEADKQEAIADQENAKNAVDLSAQEADNFIDVAAYCQDYAEAMWESMNGWWKFIHVKENKIEEYRAACLAGYDQ